MRLNKKGCSRHYCGDRGSSTHVQSLQGNDWIVNEGVQNVVQTVCLLTVYYDSTAAALREEN